jgi:hypothetical protein
MNSKKFISLYILAVFLLGLLVVFGGDGGFWIGLFLFGIINIFIWNFKIGKNIKLNTVLKVLLNIIASFIVFILSAVLMWYFAILMLGINF